MATFTLNDLRNEVSKKYAPTVIENGKDTYTLQNMLQLPTKKRKEVMELVDSVGGDDEGGSSIEDQLEIFRKIIIAAEEDDKGDELLELLGDNTAMIYEVVSSWMETTQLGEAGSSSEQ